jgi:Mce-associated membrane protein
VAVPPAPDGEAVGDPSDSTDTTRTDSASGPRGPLWLLIGVFVIVLGCLIASVVALGRAGWSVDDLVDEQRDPQSQREQVMTVARTFVTQFSTYGPDDLNEQNKMPEYAARIEEMLTAKFASGFEQSVSLAEQTVAQQNVTRTGDVYAVGVVRMDEDTARVLVAGTNTFALPDEKKPEELLPYSEQPFRFEVDLVWTQGEWLIDNFGPVGTLDAATPEQLPSQPTPSTPPGPTDTTAPGDGGDGQ